MEQFEIEQIPSVFESNNVELRFVSKDLVNGLKILEEDQAYIVGNLALNEGISPHKNINSSPSELDYKLLMKAGLLISNQKLGSPLTITTGFPFSTFQLYKDEAAALMKGETNIEYDTSPYSKGGRKKIVTEVENAYVMPEAVACALAMRKHNQANGNFFMLSLGYGTFEAIFSTEGGLVQRSSLSTFGLRYAVNLLASELSKQYYLDLKNEHQIDTAFRNSFIFLNRKKVDLTEMRRDALKRYYQDVISPGMRKAFDDKDFEKSKAMYVAGGGALYPELVEFFEEEFKDIIHFEVAEGAPYLAAVGYCYNSLAANGGDRSKAVGLDIGNSSTVICNFLNEH
jgi:plasmid segregation protein ParM